MLSPTGAQLNATRLTPASRAKYAALTNTRNVMEAEFTVTPIHISWHRNLVDLDITRSKDAMIKVEMEAPKIPVDHIARNAYIDIPNDEGASNFDNNLTMYSSSLAGLAGVGNHNRIYSFDGPGRPREPRVTGRLDRIQFRMNAFEFARIKIGVGNKFVVSQNVVLQGSRASEFVNWHSWLDVHAVADPLNNGNRIWARGNAARNEIAQDQGAHPPLNNFT